METKIRAVDFIPRSSPHMAERLRHRRVPQPPSQPADTRPSSLGTSRIGERGDERSVTDPRDHLRVASRSTAVHLKGVPFVA
jgi:hypothetical protein